LVSEHQALIAFFGFRALVEFHDVVRTMRVYDTSESMRQQTMLAL